MRISCLGLARICIDGKYLLIVNETRLNKLGVRILSPVGGALEARPNTSYLEETFGATNFEKGMDLRFHVDNARVEAVKSWYERRVGRETSVLREVYEELTIETRALAPEDLHGVRETPLDIVYFEENTVRPSAFMTLTTYCVESYLVELPHAAIAKLKAAAGRPSSMIYLASKAEIENGQMLDGTEIGGISKKILPSL